MNIVSEKNIRKILLSIGNPGRYSGCEYGSHDKRNLLPDILKTAISYPDLYEIGMSNNAVRILYSMFNNMDNVVCDRVFTPDKDLEELLIQSKIPLFTLENRFPLSELDIMGFSFGYELTATNILNMLYLGGIPIEAEKRVGEKYPVVIAGGPGVTNPIPYGDFLDCVFLGEAEEEIVKLYKAAAEIKKTGGRRDDIISVFRSSPNMWYKGKTEKTVSAVYGGFSYNQGSYKYYPIPAVKTVQDHGVVEIMRGCPNGCRFCHAGFFYRPKREKLFSVIDKEIEKLVFDLGYREITLSSLSSGDYKDILPMIEKLSKKYSPYSVSFSLPSLKVNTFTMELLSGLGQVRKSGLTFAVETPEPEGQRSLNKEVDITKTIEIIKQAKAAGWRVAKFYFMLGLPVFQDGETERVNSPEINRRISDGIIDFLLKVLNSCSITLNVNIGTFVPKPHTPYQWCAQIGEEDALKEIYYIKGKLKGKNIKLGYQSPMMSFVEGIFSRGDERVGKILLDAFNAGCRLDGWNDFFDMEKWKKVIENQDWNVTQETSRERTIGEKFPWNNILCGATPKYLEKEYKKAFNGEITLPCCNKQNSEDSVGEKSKSASDFKCSHNCGICGREDCPSFFESNEIESNKTTASPLESDNLSTEDGKKIRHRAIFSFSKKGSHIYIGHLDLMRLFERAFQRSRLKIAFTEGFNPKPRLEFASPLSLGMESEGEIAAVETSIPYEPEEFISKLNIALPAGITVKNAVFQKINVGDKKHSLMSLYSGSYYQIIFPKDKNFETVLEKYIAENNLGDSTIVETAGENEKGKVFYIQIKQNSTASGEKNNKGKSLFKLLKESLGEENPLLNIAVLREKMYAKGSDCNETDYFSFFR